MTNIKDLLLSQKTLWALLVVLLTILIFPLLISGGNVIHGQISQENSQQGASAVTEIKKAQGEDSVNSEPGPTPKARNHFDYYLSFTISVITGLGVFLLVYLTFSDKHEKGTEEQRNALYLIVVALIVEAVLISGVLDIDVKQYESIYAAIAGYVLGSMGKQSPSPNPNNSEENTG